MSAYDNDPRVAWLTGSWAVGQCRIDGEHLLIPHLGDDMAWINHDGSVELQCVQRTKPLPELSGLPLDEAIRSLIGDPR